MFRRAAIELGKETKVRWDKPAAFTVFVDPDNPERNIVKVAFEVPVEDIEA